MNLRTFLIDNTDLLMDDVGRIWKATDLLREMQETHEETGIPNDLDREIWIGSGYIEPGSGFEVYDIGYYCEDGRRDDKIAFTVLTKEAAKAYIY